MARRCRTRPRRQLIGRYEAAFAQQRKGSLAIDGRIHVVSMGERLASAHGVQAAQKAAELAQRRGVVELGLAAGAACGHGEAVALPGRQGGRLAVQLQACRVGVSRQDQGRHHGDFGFGQLEREAVLFNDLRITPARGPVELGHHRAAVFEEDLEHAVFVRVQLQDTAVATQAHGVQGIEHVLRCQGVVLTRGRGRLVGRLARRRRGHRPMLRPTPAKTEISGAAGALTVCRPAEHRSRRRRVTRRPRAGRRSR